MQTIHRARCAPCLVRGVLLASLMLGSTMALAVDFPVTGTITVNGTPAALPVGSFDNSSYDGTSGVIAPGRFTFPRSTVTFDSPLGPVIAKYELSQTDTAGGDVDEDGVAALSLVTMQLSVVSATLYGFPFPLGTCVFKPIELALAGVGSANGLDLSDPAFTIPPVASSDCGNNGDAINSGIAGSENAIELNIAGDFTPPTGADDDTIFADGFELLIGNP